MKTLYRVFVCALLLQVLLPVTWADEGEIPGCGEDADCDTCINNAVKEAKEQVVESEDSDSGSSNGSSTTEE